MAGTGLPIPKSDDVILRDPGVIGAGAYSVAQSWLNIAQNAAQTAAANRQEAAAYEKIADVGAHAGKQAGQLYQQEKHEQQVAYLANFEVEQRAKTVEARDKFTNDPEGFKQWSDAVREGALSNVPDWALTHAKQFMSREHTHVYGAILGERRSEEKRIAAQDTTARVKMADDDVMSVASNGGLNTPEGKAALATHKGILDASVATGLIGPDHAQLLTEDLITRAHGTLIRNDVEQVYREKGYAAAREHLDAALNEFGGAYRIKDQIRTKTLGWLRSEEAGMRGARDEIGKEWAAAKGQIATLEPAVLQDIQRRAYDVGNFKVGDDIQAHSSALAIARNFRQLPQADQVRIAATGNFDARLAQRESGGDPTIVNKLGYVGTYQFGAPRLADLGVYTPGSGENLAGWSKTPANAPGKWSGTFNIPGFPDVKTLGDFRANPEAQKATYALHQQRMDKEIDDLGLGQYVGQTVGGVQITRDGIKAMIHLGGAGGARATLASGGGVNPADANGTTLLDYARMGTGESKPGDLTGSRPGLIALGMLKKDLTQDLTKKIADFQGAINKTEFPPMEDIGALGAQVHLLGNEEQKRQVAEMAAQAEYGRKFMTLPLAQREEIIGKWNEKLKAGASQYERHLADVTTNANRKITEEYGKDPYGAAYRFMDGIDALPAIDWSSPNVGQHLAVKASQQATIRADQNLPVFSALRPGEAQSLAAQFISGDPRATKQIIETMAASLPPDIYQATIGDGPIKAALNGMIRSYDPAKLDIAMSTLDRAERADPIGFKQAFGDSTAGRLNTWQALREYKPPIEMAAHFQRTDDPAFATARKHLESEADDKIEGLTPQKVANDLGSIADRWVPFVNQAPPVDPLAANALVAEYETLFKERYVATQDVDRAKAQTVERLKTSWGPSVANGGALMKHPPERYYPQVDGSHDWMKRDLEASISASRLGAEPYNPFSDVSGPDISYKLISDTRTDADVSAKRAPSYVVMVTDTATGRVNIPLDWQGRPMRFSFDPAKAQAEAREKFTTLRPGRLEPAPFGPMDSVGP